MAVFELYLDGNQMNDVPKFNEFTETLERDFNVRGIVLKYPNTLKVFGDAFRYLYDEWGNNGYCKIIDVTIQKLENGEKTRIDGSIFLSDVSWNWDEGSVEVTIEDNSWSARIYNNWQIPINLKSTLTKNGEAITPPTTRSIQIYDPNAAVATYLPSNREGIELVDALTHMIKWATDNVVTFESDFLSGLNYALMLTTGNSIRTAVEDTYELSLQSLLTNVMKIYNLWFRIVDNKDGTFTFKLEQFQDFYDSVPTQKFSNIKGVQQMVEADMLFGSVKVGGDAKKDLNGTLALPYYRMTGFAIEDYYFAGNCNLSSILDLTYQIICDTNIIEDVAVNGNDDYDDDYFFIQFNTGANLAFKNKYADTAAATVAPFYYNEPMLNANIINRYELPNTLLQTFGNDDDTFEANLSADSANLVASTTSLSPLVFDNEISDVSGSYNPANGRYTAGANGTFTFSLDFYSAFITNNNLTSELTITATLYVRDSGGTVRETVVAPSVTFSGKNTGIGSNAFRYYAQWIQYMDSSASAEVHITMSVAGSSGYIYKYYKESTFKCIATEDGGGQFFTQDPNDYKCVKLAFQNGIAEENWNTVKDSPTALYSIDRNGTKTMNAWIKRIERNILTSSVEVEFLTNLAQTNKIGI